MPSKKTATVIPFPRAKNQTSSTETDVFAELKAALTEAVPSPQVRKPKSPRPEMPVAINGDGAQVVTGTGTINNHTYHVESVPKPTVIVQTGVGVIDARQKRKLLELRDGVVEASAAGTRQKTPGGVMLALNKHMKVNTYSEILSADFEKAVNYLMRQRAIKNSLPSAKKKLPSWRNARIRAVHSRCKELDLESWRLEHMRKKFGKESMVELGDDDLEALYRAVMAKK